MGREVILEYDNLGRRDHFKFLFELCEAYKLYKTETKWPRISWHRLLSLHNARWNSRGIFTLIAFFFLPNWRDHLMETCDLIATTWARIWFSNQHNSEIDYKDLRSAISRLQCPKGMKCFSTHLKNEPSIIDIPRCNIVAERAIKLMEEVLGTCKTDKYLNSKFINTNTQLWNTI